MSHSLLLLALRLASSDPDTTLHLPRNGAVEIDTHNRDITLRTGANDLVVVRGARAELEGKTLSISADDRHSRTSTGPIDVLLPAWARVEISTVTGNLTVTDAPERLHAESMNGFIHVNGGSGTVELETVAGEVSVTGFKGATLSIDATAGKVSVVNSTGTITIDNVNSDIVLRGIRATTVSASTVNGAIEFEGIFAPNGNYEFNSQNDDVTLIVPGDVSARMKITTMNGELRTPQIPATVNGTQPVTPSKGKIKDKHRDQNHEDGEHTFTAIFGAGAARVTVDVFNGDVIVKKKP